MTLPKLYSYRRCPYAMRARMVLKYAGIAIEIIEISLKDKPAEMLKASPKGTVPVLVIIEGGNTTVIDESLQIMAWGLANNDPDNWLTSDAKNLVTQHFISENDTTFKQSLDRYKYAIRFPEKSPSAHRGNCEVFLIKLENLLSHNNFLSGESIGLTDIAIFPFVRQFAGVDEAWFENLPYPKLRAWLKANLESKLFLSVMKKT
ncbi:MAG: glutathione S-transferase [Methylophilaceae bacterium]|nr:glutathione S-transferase [Methylophilaceae bacterium]